MDCKLAVKVTLSKDTLTVLLIGLQQEMYRHQQHTGRLFLLAHCMCALHEDDAQQIGLQLTWLHSKSRPCQLPPHE